MGRIYTRTGDDGTTGLVDGSRVPKSHLRVEAYGTLDEANAALGHCVRLAGEPTRARLLGIQSQLFTLGADLATPVREGERLSQIPAANERDIHELEGWIDESEAQLPPMRHFVLPGGCELASWLHTARVTVRRAERLIVCLMEHERSVNPLVLVYANRLSDLLFSWCRLANQQAGVPDVPWIPATAL